MKKHLKYIIILGILSFIIMMPMIFNVYYSADDTPIHIANIYSISKTISLNSLFPNVIMPFIGRGFGYGNRLFYPPLAYVIGAYINYIFGKFGIGIIGTMKFLNSIITLLSALSMYYCSYTFNKNKKISLLSSVIYITFPYFISDIYVRDAMAERYLFVFIPLIFVGIYNFFEGNLLKFYPLFIVGYVGGILSHFTLMIYFSILFLIFLIIYYKKIFVKDRVKHLIIAGLIILFIVSPFFVTMLSHRFLGNYSVFKKGVMVNNMKAYSLSIIDYFNIFQKGNHNIKTNMSLVTTLLLLFTILKIRKIKFPKYSFGLFIISLLAFIMSLNIFPWRYVPYVFRMIQFPWRFQVFYLFIISLLIPSCLSIIKEKHLACMLIVIYSIGVAYYNVNHTHEYIATDNDIWYEAGMGWQKEYLPVNMSKNIGYYYNRGEDILPIGDMNAIINVIEDDVPYLKFSVSNLDEQVELEFPRIYYLGYRLKHNNGNIELYENKNGFLTAKINLNGTYELDYSGTTLYNICLGISVITIFASFTYYFYIIKRRNVL